MVVVMEELWDSQGSEVCFCLCQIYVSVSLCYEEKIDE